MPLPPPVTSTISPLIPGPTLYAEVGDTLVYDIHVDGHANQGDVRLFFFHYDCLYRLLKHYFGRTFHFNGSDNAPSSPQDWHGTAVALLDHLSRA